MPRHEPSSPHDRINERQTRDQEAGSWGDRCSCPGYDGPFAADGLPGGPRKPLASSHDATAQKAALGERPSRAILRVSAANYPF